jgi:hypothetical protein
MQNATNFSKLNTSIAKFEDPKEILQERQQTIRWLQVHNYPVLPVAPVQDAIKHHKEVQANTEKGVWQHCPLTADLRPIPLYTGKNPSYLDKDGVPHLVNHRQYQNRLPRKKELKTWFANPLNGIGTLGGWHGTVWLDFDVKKFASQIECDEQASEIAAKVRDQAGSEPFLERSHSGGWRIGVRVKQKPSFTNFALAPGGKHIGEALFEGRFTVLAPTIGPSGNPYESLNRTAPPLIESLECIGIYSTKSAREKHSQDLTPPSFDFEAIPGTIPLEELGNLTSREILSGANPKGDRSDSLTTAINEWYGWVNWTAQNGVAISSSPEALAHHAGQQLGLDSDRINRILKSVGGGVSLEPAALRLGGEESCWKKIYKLDKAAFEAKCPAHIKTAVLRDWKTGNRSSGSQKTVTCGKHDSARERGAVALLEKPEQQNNTLNSNAPHQKIDGGSTLGGSGGGNRRGNGDGTDHGGSQPQNQWQAPTTWNGEIGWLIKDEDNDGLPITKFYPKCNFDFQIESELSSDEGGGLVLQVKRSLDSHQKRVIISCQDYGSTRDFEAALKRVYKTGVVCNLKTEHLKALIHVKLREYRARHGITYRLQDRAGQQEDGHWVFEKSQLTPDGDWSASPNSDWIFNADLGGEDKMPQPIISPPDPDALKRLVTAMHKFHGAEGIFPAMMALGFAAAAVHYRTILKKERRFPQLNLIGDAGSNKSVCAANALSLVGWLNGDGQISGVSESKLYECLKLTGSLPLCLDDPPKSRELDEILKRLYNAIPRMVRGNYQKPHSPLMVTSNHAIGDQQLATLTRMLQVPVYRQSDGDAGAWDEMVEAMEGASGCLPDLIKLGYPSSEIKELEKELRSHLPKSHPRIASSMALITWYAMAVARLASFDADSIKRYVMEQLCPIANAADSNCDSITDFLDKLSALKSEALVGDWNCLLVETKAGKALAVQMSQVFPLVDKHFNPVYSRKVLEALIAKAGGSLQSVQKFHSNRDESLAYYRAKITAESESHPREPEYKPKRCVLIPLHLIKGFTDDWKPPTPPDTPDTRTPPSSDSPHNDSVYKPVTSSVTPVTANNSQLHEKCNQQDVDPVFDSAISDSPVTSFLEKSIDLNHQNQDAITDALGDKRNCHTLTPQKNVTEEDFESESLIDTEGKRLHKSCNQDVTDCNQETRDVTEEVAQADAPAPSVEQTASTSVDEAIAPSPGATPDTLALVSEEVEVDLWMEESTIAEIAQDLANESFCDGKATLAILRTAWEARAATQSEREPIQVGDKVSWNECPGHLSWMNPFVVEAIEGDRAKLEYCTVLAPLTELRRC